MNCPSRTIVAIILLVLVCAGCTKRRYDGFYQSQEGMFEYSLDLRSNGGGVFRAKVSFRSQSEGALALAEATEAELNLGDVVWWAEEGQITVVGTNARNAEKREKFSVEPNGDLVLQRGKGVRLIKRSQ